MFRVGFLGRGRLGLHVLEGLLANPHVQVPVVISCSATPEVADIAAELKSLAAAAGADYFATNQINGAHWAAKLAGYDLDLAVAMLWLHAIDAATIATSRLGFLNCHGGHLPAYRGNACANWAILNGEPAIGTTVHLMRPDDLDSGPVVMQEQVRLAPDATIGAVVAELEEKGLALVLASVEAFRLGTAVAVPQDEEQASYCYPRLPRDGEIDWTRDADSIDRLIRAAGRPYPGAYSWYMDHLAGGAVRRMTVWRAHVAEHPLGDFHAVAGHVLKLEQGARRAVVCGDKRLMVLDEIDIDGVGAAPEAAFRTVRQRLGLDLSLLVARAGGWRDAGEDLAALAGRFVSVHAAELERLQGQLVSAVDAALTRLHQAGMSVSASPLTDRSFRRSGVTPGEGEWRGIDFSRPLQIRLGGASFSFGLWTRGARGGGLDHRLFVAPVDGDEARAAGAAAALAGALPGGLEVSRCGPDGDGFSSAIPAAVGWEEALVALGRELGGSAGRPAHSSGDSVRCGRGGE